jgi:hypothetical protein
VSFPYGSYSGFPLLTAPAVSIVDRGTLRYRYTTYIYCVDNRCVFLTRDTEPTIQGHKPRMAVVEEFLGTVGTPGLIDPFMFDIPSGVIIPNAQEDVKPPVKDCLTCTRLSMDIHYQRPAVPSLQSFTLGAITELQVLAWTTFEVLPSSNNFNTPYNYDVSLNSTSSITFTASDFDSPFSRSSVIRMRLATSLRVEGEIDNIRVDWAYQNYYIVDSNEQAQQVASQQQYLRFQMPITVTNAVARQDSGGYWSWVMKEGFVVIMPKYVTPRNANSWVRPSPFDVQSTGTIIIGTDTFGNPILAPTADYLKGVNTMTQFEVVGTRDAPAFTNAPIEIKIDATIFGITETGLTTVYVTKPLVNVAQGTDTPVHVFHGEYDENGIPNALPINNYKPSVFVNSTNEAGVFV